MPAAVTFLMSQAVAPGSTMRTDGWGGYNGLNELGYRHKVIRPTPAVGVNLLPLANRVAALLKRWLPWGGAGA